MTTLLKRDLNQRDPAEPHARVEPPAEIIKLPRVLAIIGCGRMTPYDWLRQGRFPEPIKLQPMKPGRISNRPTLVRRPRVGFRAVKIAEWLTTREYRAHQPSKPQQRLEI